MGDILITDLHPDRMVLQSMNMINAAQRQRLASVESGEAQKVLLGFKQSMDAMAEGGLSAKESMNMMITTQYVDMLQDFARNPNKSSIMVPSTGGSGSSSKKSYLV